MWDKSRKGILYDPLGVFLLSLILLVFLRRSINFNKIKLYPFLLTRTESTTKMPLHYRYSEQHSQESRVDKIASIPHNKPQKCIMFMLWYSKMRKTHETGESCKDSFPSEIISGCPGINKVFISFYLVLIHFANFLKKSSFRISFRAVLLQSSLLRAFFIFLFLAQFLRGAKVSDMILPSFEYFERKLHITNIRWISFWSGIKGFRVKGENVWDNLRILVVFRVIQLIS